MSLILWKTTVQPLYFQLATKYYVEGLAVSLLSLCLMRSATAQVSTITVSFTDNITVCSQAQTATVTFTATDTLTDIKGVFNLSMLAGFDTANFSSADFIQMGDMFLFTGPYIPGMSGTAGVLTFTIAFTARCGATNLGSSGNVLPIDFTYLIDGTIVEMNTGMSPAFSVTQPGLDFIGAATDMFRPVVNEPDTITKTIANGGDGDLDSALYFVVDHPNLVLCQVFVEGTLGTTHILDLAASADTMFYWIGADAIMTTGNGDAIWGGLGGGQEQFTIYEVWKGFDCSDMPPVIYRGVGYGCTVGVPLDLCTSSPSNNSTVTFDRVPDLVSGQYDWGDSNPACYADDNTQVGYFVTNIGEAPADTVVIDLSSSGTGDIITYQYTLIGSGGPYNDGLMGANIGSGCGGTNSVIDTIFDANLAVGDTLWIRVEMRFDCMCNPSCGISGIYRSDLDVEAIDRCGDGLPGSGASWSDYGVSIGGFVEGPFEIKDGESGCITYTITSYRNNWFNGSYSNSYYEMDFNFPAGLEIDPTMVVWEDADGTLFFPDPMPFLFTDGDPTSGDTLRVRWSQTSIPSGWVAGAGTQIEICFDAVCVNPCGGEMNVDVTAQMDFVIDPMCATCSLEEAFCPPSLPMVLKCFDPLNPMCACVGVGVLDLDINRMNYGMGDNNNNKCPEGGESIDFNLVETKRYLQGDTLKADVKAVIKGSGPNPWINSSFQLVTQTEQITPIGGEIRIVDASAMSSYLCDVLSMQLATSPMGDTINVNLDTTTLRSFCSDSIPAGYTFADGDTLELCLIFTVKEDFDGQQQPRFFETIWTVDDGVNPPVSCNQESDRLTQIGISESYNVDIDNPFGGCEKSAISVTESRYYGSEGFDEFPFEVRMLGMPEDFVYVKPAEFAYSLDMFGFTLSGSLTGSQVSLSMGDPSLAPFILITGDSLIFKAGDYLKDLGSAKLPPDEGYTASFFPRIQGDCRSFAGFFSNSASLSSSVDPITFCTPVIDRSAVTQMIEYTGGPQLTVIPDAPSIVIDQPNQCLSFTLTNSTTISAPNSFLYITSPTGNVVVNSLIETTGGGSTPIPGTPLGIYQLGFTPGSPDRTFDICVTVNSCGTEQLNFIAGWDCNQYPTTVLEATCQDPSIVTFTTGTAGLGLLVTKPSIDTVVNLCDTILYEAIMNSTMAGSLRDVVLSFDLPVGHEYVLGSFEYQWPQLPPSGFISAPDPDNPYGNFYTTTVTDLDPTLATDGLPGNSQIPNNAVRIRFKVVTTCDIVSGTAASFFARALNACGDPVNQRFFPGKRVFIDGALAAYDIRLDASDLILNPCAMDMSTVDVDVVLTAGPGIMTAVGDTIRAVLPPGIFYKPGSYMPGINASLITDPIISNLGGQQVLDWPILAGLTNGTLIQFNFGVAATDGSQECRDYDML
ncbi:MAG: hypothetical protein OEQ53_12450, partial [Saprospiraceae bacterium]|nr:hypothetical protein [Saprospiraceae bacterium]